MTPKRPLIERFWEKVKIGNSDECWEWQKAKDQCGYGMIAKDNSWNIHEGAKTSRSHRIAWELTYGSIPEGLWVLHRCDNPSCCNPKHLFLGTCKDNSDDKISKNRDIHSTHPRGARGEKHPKHKLTMKQVLEIRSLASQGARYKILAPIYGVDETTICDIVRRKSWKFLESNYVK